MIKEKDVIEIDKKNYEVIKTIKYDNCKYAYIINIDNYSDTLFIKENKKDLEIVKQKELLNDLIVKFNSKMCKVTD